MNLILLFYAIAMVCYPQNFATYEQNPTIEELVLFCYPQNFATYELKLSTKSPMLCFVTLKILLLMN